jgi:cytochrome c biogenesis protein CcmG/thiol:disulfide interchange protein DsbE
MKRTLIGLLAAIACLAGGCSRIAPGRPAPAFVLKDLQGGGEIDSARLAGKVILLVFWASWAPPCRLAMPDLIRIQWKYDRKHFNVVAVAVDDEEESVKRYLREAKANFPVLLAGADTRKMYFGDGDVKLPLALLLDDGGIILKRFVGYTDAGEIEAAIEQALKKIIIREGG